MVQVYRVRVWTGHLLIAMVVVGGTVLNALIIGKYDCKVGVLAVENTELVDKYFSKPWTKLFAVGLGVWFAWVYCEILKYRSLGGRTETSANCERKEKYPTLHWLHRAPLTSNAIFFLGLFIFLFDLLIGHPAIAAPYAWTTLQNQLYFSICRFSFTFAFILMLLPVFLGHKPIFQHAVSTPFILACAKTTYFVALAHPIIIALLYNTGQKGMFVKLPVVLYLGLGNVACETVIGVAAWLMLEYPVARVFKGWGCLGLRDCRGK